MGWLAEILGASSIPGRQTTLVEDGSLLNKNECEDRGRQGCGARMIVEDLRQTTSLCIVVGNGRFHILSATSNLEHLL